MLERKSSMAFVQVSSGCSVRWGSHGVRSVSTRRRVAVAMSGVERETVRKDERQSTDMGRKRYRTMEEKAEGNGTPPPFGKGGPAKALGNAWPGMAVGLAAQSLPVLSKAPLSDALYFFLVATGALYAGGKRNPTEIPVDDLSPLQALLAPVISGGFLFGCYLLLRYTQIDIGQIFQYATTVFGGICLKEALDPIFFSLFTKLNVQPVTKALGEDGCQADGEKWYSPKNIASISLAAAVTASYATHFGPSFFFSNLIGFGISVRCISLLKPKTVWSAAALLTGLLLYDCFFVFGTDVMVSVATGIEAPAKFLFPRDPEAVKNATSAAMQYPFAILGLGDVVIPGIFASLMTFVDKELVFGDEREVSHVPNGPYFNTAVFSYVLGLFICFGVNFTTKSAQPALLYLVPSLLISTAVTAARRGELKDLVTFKRQSQTSIVERERS